MAYAIATIGAMLSHFLRVYISKSFELQLGWEFETKLYLDPTSILCYCMRVTVLTHASGYFVIQVPSTQQKQWRPG